MIDSYRKTRKDLLKLRPNAKDKPHVDSMIREMTFVIEWLKTGEQPRAHRGMHQRYGAELEVPLTDNIRALRATICEPDAQVRERIENALRKLTGREKEAYYLVYGEGFSEYETADIMGIRRSSVRVMIERATHKINLHISAPKQETLAIG